LCDTAIQAVFCPVVLARFLYASPTWRGFAGVQDRQKVEGFLYRSTRPDSAPNTCPTLATFAWRLIKIYSVRYRTCVASTSSPLSASSHSYSLRIRAHNRQLPDRLSHLLLLSYACYLISHTGTYISFYSARNARIASAVLATAM